MGNIDVPIVGSRHCTVPHNWPTSLQCFSTNNPTSQVALADPKVEPAATKVEPIFTFFVFQKLIFDTYKGNFCGKKKNGPNSPDLNFLKNKVTRFLQQPNVFLCENSHSCKFWKTFVISSMRVFFFKFFLKFLY